MRRVSVRRRPVTSFIENGANLRFDELAETFASARPITNGRDNLFGRSDPDIGGDEELLQRLDRVHVDWPGAIGLAVSLLDDLVEPVDDLRATNPPSNGPLLDALADHYRKVGYDQKKLLRTILTSQVYGLSSLPNTQNVGDLRNYSRRYRQRLRGEVLLDALTDITGVPEVFAAAPPRTRPPRA